MTIEVFSPGFNVTIGENIPAIILQVAIKRGGRVEYEVAWWNGRSRVTDWLIASEVQADSQEMPITRIGFGLL